MKLSYYRNLDGVRAIAALMVIICHFFQQVEINSSVLGFFKASVFGQAGVTMFFVLSGFLISRILISTRNDDHYFKTFYLRRTLRIFPLYYFFLLSYYFAFPYVFNTPVASPGQQVWYYVYLQNIAATFNWNAAGPSHFWSLAVEEHFYLFWPLMIFFLSTRNLYYLIGAIIVVAFVLRIVIFSAHYDVVYFTFTRFDELAIGALLALLEQRKTLTRQNASKFAGLMVFMMIPTAVFYFIFTGEANLYIQAVKYNMVSFTCFGFIGMILCLTKDNPVNRILESGYFSYTGKISYGLYVYHPLAFALMVKFVFSGHLWLDFILAFAATYTIATASFYLYEKRFLALKRFARYEPGDGQDTPPIA